MPVLMLTSLYLWLSRFIIRFGLFLLHIFLYIHCNSLRGILLVIRILLLLSLFHFYYSLFLLLLYSLGKDVIIIVGDWSGKGRIRYRSTPNIALKRKLAERFEVYLLDEYLTSKIHYKYHVKCDNISVIDKNQKT